jgi:hypothetical protein
MSRALFACACLTLHACFVPDDERGGGPTCSDDCVYALDGECDDGGPGSDTAACGLGTDCGDCGARGAPPSSGGPYACVGTANDPTHYGDSSSCRLGAGIWVNTYHDCESGYADDCDDVFVTPSDLAYARTSCLERIGCAFRSGDGTSEMHPLVGGECFGVTPACGALSDEATCNAQGFMCDWDDPSPVNAGGCSDANGYIALYNVRTCAGISAFAESGSAHWEIAHDACLDLFGCSWRHPDGRVETSEKSGFPAPP